MITNALGVPPKLTNQSREIHLNLNLSTVEKVSDDFGNFEKVDLASGGYAV